MKNTIEHHETVISTGHLNLRGLVWGQGRVALALHGWMDNAMSFCTLAPLLTSTQCVALDLPGHGRSDHRPPGTRYHFVDYIADVCSVVATLRTEYAVDRIDVIGHSLGAAIASMVAGVIPEEIDRLVLIEGLGPRTREADEVVAIHQTAISQQRTPRRRPTRTITDIDAAVKARLLVGKLARNSAQYLVERNLMPVADGWQWGSDARLRDGTAVYWTEAIVRAHLEAITAKTLVIRALDEEDAGRRWILDRLSCVSEVQLVELPGAHHLHLDTPAPVADAINSFLQRS